MGSGLVRNRQPVGISSQVEYWQQRYAQGDTPWNKGRAHPALVRWLESATNVAGTRVVVPGCGWGYDVMAWAAAGAEAWGLDCSARAVAGARQIHPAGHFREGSIFAPPEDWLGLFDWVFEHTCFCAIDPADRPLYVAGAWSLLREGGFLWAVFYQDPPHEEGPPFAVSEEQIAALFGLRPAQGGVFSVVTRWMPEETFPGREQRESCWILRKEAAPGGSV